MINLRYTSTTLDVVQLTQPKPNSQYDLTHSLLITHAMVTGAYMSVMSCCTPETIPDTLIQDSPILKHSWHTSIHIADWDPEVSDVFLPCRHAHSSHTQRITSNFFSYSTRSLSPMRWSVSHIYLAVHHYNSKHNGMGFIPRCLPDYVILPSFITKLHVWHRVKAWLSERVDQVNQASFPHCLASTSEFMSTEW